MKPKYKEVVVTRAGKSKTFGTVSAMTTEPGRRGEQSNESKGGPENHTAGTSIELKVPPVDMMDLMRKLE